MKNLGEKMNNSMKLSYSTPSSFILRGEQDKSEQKNSFYANVNQFTTKTIQPGTTGSQHIIDFKNRRTYRYDED